MGGAYPGGESEVGDSDLLDDAAAGLEDPAGGCAVGEVPVVGSIVDILGGLNLSRSLVSIMTPCRQIVLFWRRDHGVKRPEPDRKSVRASRHTQLMKVSPIRPPCWRR